MVKLNLEKIFIYLTGLIAIALILWPRQKIIKYLLPDLENENGEEDESNSNDAPDA